MASSIVDEPDLLIVRDGQHADISCDDGDRRDDDDDEDDDHDYKNYVNYSYYYYAIIVKMMLITHRVSRDY